MNRERLQLLQTALYDQHLNDPDSYNQEDIGIYKECGCAMRTASLLNPKHEDDIDYMPNLWTKEYYGLLGDKDIYNFVFGSVRAIEYSSVYFKYVGSRGSTYSWTAYDAADRIEYVLSVDKNK